MEKLKVIVVPVGEKPQVKEIPHRLETLQKIVGGYIETALTPFENVVILCNEEGMIHDLPQNILGIYGDFIFIAVDPPEFTSLNDKQIEEIMANLEGV